jgi:hypothetical protein
VPETQTLDVDGVLRLMSGRNVDTCLDESVEVEVVTLPATVGQLEA